MEFVLLRVGRAGKQRTFRRKRDRQTRPFRNGRLGQGEVPAGQPGKLVNHLFGVGFPLIRKRFEIGRASRQKRSCGGLRDRGCIRFGYIGCQGRRGRAPLLPFWSWCTRRKCHQCCKQQRDRFQALHKSQDLLSSGREDCVLPVPVFRTCIHYRGMLCGPKTNSDGIKWR